MLGYLTRTLALAIRAQLGQDGRLVSRISRRVKLSEIDLNLHMNQASYAQMYELGRTDWLLRSGAWDRWRAQDVKPVLAEQRIIYRREMKPPQRYTIDTRAIGFDGRLLCLEGHMITGDQVRAKTEAKLIFIGPDGVLSAEATEAACREYVTEALPVEAWRVR